MATINLLVDDFSIAAFLSRSRWFFMELSNNGNTEVKLEPKRGQNNMYRRLSLKGTSLSVTTSVVRLFNAIPVEARHVASIEAYADYRNRGAHDKLVTYSDLPHPNCPRLRRVKIHLEELPPRVNRESVSSIMYILLGLDWHSNLNSNEHYR